MAERQYIGARYVPKFAEPLEWQTNVSYEPLTIVTYLGGSYTSKKRVPAGINPQNGEYWANTGNYNAQIEEYRQLTLAVKDEVDNLEKITSLKDKKILVFGDSISWENWEMSNWIPALRELVGEYCTIENDSVSGRKMIELPAAVAAHTTWDYDKVIIFLGTNDYGNNTELGNFGDDTSKFTDCIKLAVTAINQKFSQAGKKSDIMFITPLMRGGTVVTNSLGYPLWYYNAAIVSYCKYLGLKWINGYGFPLMSDFYITNQSIYVDDVHPNPTYGRIMAEYILQKICSGGDKQGYNSSSMRCNKTNSIQTYITNEEFHIVGRNVGITITSNYQTLLTSLPELVGGSGYYQPCACYRAQNGKLIPAMVNITSANIGIWVESASEDGQFAVGFDIVYQPSWLYLGRQK